MGMFSSIMSKLGFGDDKKEAVQEVETVAQATTTAPEEVIQPEVIAETVEIVASDEATAEPEVASIPQVDVVAQLEALAAESSQPLNWKTSIVDLLKLLGLDSSYSARKELAAELECPAEKMADSAQMNMWLHKTVLQKLAANGGNIPADLLD